MNRPNLPKLAAATDTAAAIVDDAMARVGLPSALPPALAVGRVVECGPTYRMSERPPYTPWGGTLQPDEWYGQRGRVVAVRGDYVEIETFSGAGGGGLDCHADTLRTVLPDGTALPSPGERRIPRSRGGVLPD